MFAAPPGTPETLDEAFARFHEEHPEVYREAVRITRELVAAGHDRVGFGMVWEVMRWQRMLTTNDAASGWKLNNSYRSRMARLIMDREADLADVFETRALADERRAA